MSESALKNPPLEEPPPSGRGPIGRAIRAIGHCLADAGRLLWGYPSLNLRKQLFRVSPSRVACPCQNPSDSGKAWETGCDAVAHWHSPGRFRLLCPLLKQNPAGLWRCSVDTPEVRPFWGRALLVLLLSLCALYAGVAFGAYALLHSVIGYPVRYASVAWPPDWSEIRQARARFFFDKAERAFQSGQTLEAMMWLSQSYELDPGNYLAGRVLAQLWQNSEAEVSDRIYRQLLRDHPKESAATAQAWFLALLSRGDFSTLSGLAWDRLHHQPSESSVWLNALLVSSRRTGNTHYLEEAIAQPAGIPPYARVICSWELRLRNASRPAALALLTESIPPQSVPFAFYYRIDRLLHLGFGEEALRQLRVARARLEPRDVDTLYLDAYAAVGWQDILTKQVEELLAAHPGSAPLVELLSAHLIRYPNLPLFGKVFDAVSRHPITGSEAGKLSAYSCLFCAAGAAKDWPRQAVIANAIKKVTGARYKTLDAVLTYFQRETGTLPIEHYLPAMPPLPVDVTLALYEFSDRQRAAARIIPVR